MFNFQEVAGNGRSIKEITDNNGTPIRGIPDPTLLKDEEVDKLELHYDIKVKMFKLSLKNEKDLEEYAKIYEEQADGKIQVFNEERNFVNNDNEEPYYLVLIRFANISLVPPRKGKG